MLPSVGGWGGGVKRQLYHTIRCAFWIISKDFFNFLPNKMNLIELFELQSHVVDNVTWRHVVQSQRHVIDNVMWRHVVQLQRHVVDNVTWHHVVQLQRPVVDNVTWRHMVQLLQNHDEDNVMWHHVVQLQSHDSRDRKYHMMTSRVVHNPSAVSRDDVTLYIWNSTWRHTVHSSKSRDNVTDFKDTGNVTWRHHVVGTYFICMELTTKL